MYKFLSLIFIFVCISCAKDKSNSHIIKITHERFENENLSKYFQVIRVTCLDKNNRPIIGQIDKLLEYDNKFYLLDRFTNREIYVFSKINGVFLYKIGHKGEDPGGYVMPYDFVIDKNKKTIEVLTVGKIMIYDLHGNYKNFVNFPHPATRLSKLENGYAFVLGSRQPQLAITDQKFKIINTYFPFSFMHAMLPHNSFTYVGDKLLFHRNFENTIYEIEDGKIFGHVEFKFDQDKITEEDKRKIKSVDDVYQNFSNKKLNFEFYLESKNHILFPYVFRQEPFLFVKNKKTGNTALFEIDKTKNDLTYENSFPMPLAFNEKGNLLCYMNLGILKDFSLIEATGCQDYVDFAIVELKIDI